MTEISAGRAGEARASEERPGAGDGRAALDRPFKIIAFDWDGTAVVNRQVDATPVRQVIEQLLKLGVYVVVITGTNFQNVDKQLSAAIVGPHKRRLYVLTNRGSEVYGFAEDSHPLLLWHRVASPEEEQLLSATAEAVRDTVERRTGLAVRIVYNRLNRRKIDLIPELEWADPPKSAIGDLLRAVESRLRGGGMAGGLREVFQLTQEVAAAKGLSQARITSDVKHIEVGLTDKEDSIRWVMEDLARKAGVPAEDILIGGDEFGPIGGFEGSDYKMYTPVARGAVYVSVGKEPNGVPPGVIHLGGGPARFVELLAEQVRLHERRRDPASSEAASTGKPVRHRIAGGPSGSAKPLVPQSELAADEEFLLVEEGFEPGREHEVESLFTVANGYAGVRGSLAEGVRESRPATFLAGIFDQPPAAVTNLVVEPDWSRLRVYVEGEEVRLFTGSTLKHRRSLDMRRGTYVREWRHRDPTGRVTHLYYTRFVSLAARRAWLESVTIIPENYSARVAVESVIDGRVTNTPGIKHLEPLPVENPPSTGKGNGGQAFPPLVLRVRTRHSGLEVVYAAAGALRAEEDVEVERTATTEEGLACERWEWEAKMGLPYRFDKILGVGTSRDGADPQKLAVEQMEQLLERGADAEFAEHARAWEQRWAESDVHITGDQSARLAARFAVHHLVQSANPEDERVSIGARGLTGEAYKGHVFWDTEIYVVPFFTFTYPEAARSLLMYRYHNLPGALRKAKEMGYRGALYPWESADTGEEVTPKFGVLPDGRIIPILTGQQEHHISADVAYAVWQFWRATQDADFFRQAGAEIMLATARFWSSRAKPGPDELYHINEVIGPDEYHEAVDDNAFTNVMAQWNIERGLETVNLLRHRWPQRWAELSTALQLGEEELGEWRDVAQRMYTGFDPRTGLFEQFRGYFDLEDIDLAQFEPRTASMEVLIGHDRLQKSQIIKQSDVVMLMYLLWDRFPPEVREANFRYYAARCAHGSSLSPSIHALMAARLGDLRLAGRYFRQAAAVDLADNMGNAALGVHSACQGGVWQALVFGFGGLRLSEDGLVFEPHLPREWRSLDYAVQWRGRKLAVSVGATPRSLEIELLGGDPLAVTLGEPEGVRTTIEMGKRYRSKANKGAWRPLQERSR